MNNHGQIALRSMLGSIVLISLICGTARLAVSYASPQEVWGLISMLAAVGLGGSMVAVLLLSHTRGEKLLSAVFATAVTLLFVIAKEAPVAPWIMATVLSSCWAVFLVMCSLVRNRAPSSS